MKPDRLAALVSILGVILTTASVIASIAQYRAADLQAQAAVVALMPQLEVRALLEKVDSRKFTDRRIEISSEGGPIYNLRIDHVTWIEFRVGGRTVLREALNGYYFAGYPTARTRGALHTIKGHKNNEIYSAFLDWARSALPYGVDIAQPVTLLRLSYRDALKRDNVEFVKIEGDTETHISQEDGERLWIAKPPKTMEPRMLDINDLESQEKAATWVNAWYPVLQKAIKGG
jgi:hypothetical protein